MDDAVTALARATSALVSDALDRVGVPGRVLDPAIRPLGPGPTLAGRAVPVVVVATDRRADPPYTSEIRALDDLRPGEVPVYCVPAGVTSALWGELFTCAAIGRDAAGVVVDGPIRDGRHVRELGFPVFARGRSPLDTLGRAEVEAFRVAGVCGGVDVAPGDVVVGDEDGVVVVPAAAVGDVVSIVEGKARDEGRARADLLAGATLAEVWEKHGVL
jgi:regulator of RNase E activity RraA